MGDLFDGIKRALQRERYLFSNHADNMLRERGIMHWQILAGFNEARVLSERPRTRPNPTIEVEQVLADGTEVKCVWAHVRALDHAKLVTVHFFDR
jgi:hypothetical protein